MKGNNEKPVIKKTEYEYLLRGFVHWQHWKGDTMKLTEYVERDKDHATE